MKLFVGNLPRECSEQELTEHVNKFGQPKSVKIIMDRDTGQSRGFGFVEMQDKAAGEAVIAGLNGKEFGGRSLTVNEAREQSRDRSGGGRSDRGDRGDRRPPRRNNFR